MRRVKPFAWTASNCLLAVLMLFATSPQAQCHCSIGRTKPVLLGFLSGQTCCGSCCCEASALAQTKTQVAPNPKPTCPNCAKKQASAHQDHHRSSLQQPRCVRTIEAGEIAVPAAAHADGDASTATALEFVFASAVRFAAPDMGQEGQAHGPERLPPPTDVITLLQHLTI